VHVPGRGDEARRPVGRHLIRSASLNGRRQSAQSAR
jgi:hypothetical protein